MNRCEGEKLVKSTTVKSKKRYVQVPCTEPATTTRKNKHVLNGPKLYNFCATCAEIHDEYENELEGEARCS